MTLPLRLFVLALLLIALCVPSSAATHDVLEGTFEAPDDFTFKRTGTVDSFMGTLTRKSDGFVIQFDVGPGAGLGMSPTRKDECVFYRTHTIDGRFSYTGILQAGEQKTIRTSIFDLVERVRRKNVDRNDKSQPANFWAEIKRDSDLAEFLLIVNTYKVKAQ